MDITNYTYRIYQVTEILRREGAALHNRNTGETFGAKTVWEDYHRAQYLWARAQQNDNSQEQVDAWVRAHSYLHEDSDSGWELVVDKRQWKLFTNEDYRDTKVSAAIALFDLDALEPDSE